MTEAIHQQVSVVAIYHMTKGVVMPWRVKWSGRTYNITKLGYHHKIKDGRYVHHIFSVASDTLYFKLMLDTETLHWWLEEVSDGLAD
jgi:hypothetical protein